MPKQIEFEGKIHEFPDDFTDADIAAALSQSSAPKAPAGGMLPTAGSFVGSLVGTLGGLPGRIAGAGIGGALGKGAELLFDEKDDSVIDSLKAMGGEAVKQGAFEAAGGLVGKGLKAVAPKIADIALNPIESVARKYPNIGKTYVDVGKLFPRLRGGVGQVGKKSSTDAARSLMKASRTSGDAAIAAADAAGAAPVRGRQVIQELRPLYDEAGKLARTGKTDARPAILARAKSFARQNRAVPNAIANDMRRSLDNAAEKAFEAERRMGPPAGIEAQMDKALAGGIRNAVRTNAPQATATTKRTGELAGLTKALDKASTRKHLLTRNMALTAGALGAGGGVLSGDPQAGLGAGMGTLGAAYMLTNPRNLGRIALGTDAIGTGVQFLPEATRAALLMQLLAEQPEQK